jgi:hypothetical protein
LLIAPQHEFELSVPTIRGSAASKFMPVMVRDRCETTDVTEEMVRLE